MTGIIHYPAILWPAAADGRHGVTVPGINVNGSGSSADAALADAVAILQAVINDLIVVREPVPPPLDAAIMDVADGRMVLLPVHQKSAS